MASYKLLIKQSAARELQTVPRKDRERIIAKIRSLRIDPRPRGFEKLSADEKYRLRQGNYRILYSVEDAAMTVTIVKVGHRRDVYRK